MDFTSTNLAQYALDLTIDDISPAAEEAAKRLVYDSIGCCIGAYPSPPSKHLRSIYGGLSGGQTATVLGDGDRTLLEYAGLINAAMVRYLDFNDAYISEGRACHPSDHIPALLSVAEAEGRSGTAVIEAIVVAYEIEGLGLDTGVTWEHGYDYVTWGAFSTVTSVAKLLDLSLAETVNALGIAGSSNLTLGIARRGDVSMWKGVAHPYVTHNAIQACQMARAGMTGPEAVFEGPNGFWEVAAERDMTIDRLGGQSGADFRITDAHIKPYPCGYYMQPIIAGIVDLVEEHGIDADSITDISIETFEQAADVLAGEEKWEKNLTRESADHSIPYTAAIAVLYGNITPTHYGRTYRQEARVHRLMDLVSVAESEALNDAVRERPTSTPSTVRIATTTESYETQVDYAPGHAENPMTEDQLEQKFRGMADPVLTDAQIQTIRSETDRLDDRPTVNRLVGAVVI